MKKLLLFSGFLWLSLLSYGQVAVALDVNQPPQYGYSVLQEEITISKGESVSLGSNIDIYGGVEDYTFLWYPALSLDSDVAANPYATPTETTKYYSFVKDANGCLLSFSFTVVVSDGTGIDAVNDSKLRAYPNPVDRELNLAFTGASQSDVVYSIVDKSGKVVQSGVIGQFDANYTEVLNVNLPAGVYSLVVKSEEKTLTQEISVK